MNYCPFCEIVTDDPHGQIERTFVTSVMITPLEPVTPGHKLFIPMLRVPDATSYPDGNWMKLQTERWYGFTPFTPLRSLS